jgi:hypothetical protein
MARKKRIKESEPVPAPDPPGGELWRLSHRFVGDSDYFAEPLFLSRLANHQTVAGQAIAYGLTIADLATWALCKTPRADFRADDLQKVARHVGVTVITLERVLAVRNSFDIYAHLDIPKTMSAIRTIEAREANGQRAHLSLDELDVVSLVAGLRQADFGTLADSVYIGDAPADVNTIAKLRRESDSQSTVEP